MNTTPIKLLSLLCCLSACGKADGDSNDTGEGNTGCGIVTQPGAPAAAGQLSFTVPNDVDPCSLKSYVVGFKDQLKAEQGSGGVFFINNIPAGKHDVIITAEPKSTALADSDRKKHHSRRLKKVSILNGVKTEPGEIDLPESGAISGVVKLVGQNDQSGIDVYIPGTEFAAKTDSEGNFSLSDIPVGEHNLNFEKDGYHRGQITAIEVETEKSTSTTPVNLVLSTGAEGFLLIENGSTKVTSRTVNLTIGATSDAVLMKIAEDASFTGKGWVPLVTSAQYTFDVPGPKNLYVIFANENGLQSSPFKTSVTVDLFSDLNTTLTASPATITPPAEPNVTLSNDATPKNAVTMMVSARQDFKDTTWGDVQKSATFAFPKSQNLCGSKTIYLKYKDKDGFESSVKEATVNFNCWTYISTTNAVSMGGDSQGILGVATNAGIFFSGGTTTQAKMFYPESNSWTNLLNAPIALWGAVGVWADSKIIIWGGYIGGNSLNMNQDIMTYTPASNSWQTLTPTNNFPGRSRAAAVWTGTEMIVWGGEQSQGASPGSRNDGAGYNPATNSWRLISSSGAPTARDVPGLVWTGTEMIVSGGRSSSGFVTTGAAYNPQSDTWRNIASSPSATIARGVWNGQRLITTSSLNTITDTTGGSYLSGVMAYNPTTDSWTTYDPIYMPFIQESIPISVWYGNKMIFANPSSSMYFLPILYP